MSFRPASSDVLTQHLKILNISRLFYMYKRPAIVIVYMVVEEMWNYFPLNYPQYNLMRVFTSAAVFILTFFRLLSGSCCYKL